MFRRRKNVHHFYIFQLSVKMSQRGLNKWQLTTQPFRVPKRLIFCRSLIANELSCNKRTFRSDKLRLSWRNFVGSQERRFQYPLGSCPHGSRCSSVSIVTELRVGQPGFDFRHRHRVLNGSGAHPASYQMGTRGSFPGGKEAGTWSWPLTSI
jgi:hypothetical protein